MVGSQPALEGGEQAHQDPAGLPGPARFAQGLGPVALRREPAPVEEVRIVPFHTHVHVS